MTPERLGEAEKPITAGEDPRLGWFLSGTPAKINFCVGVFSCHGGGFRVADSPQ